MTQEEKDIYTFYLADGRMVDVEAASEEEAFLYFVSILEQLGFVKYAGKQTIH